MAQDTKTKEGRRKIGEKIQSTIELILDVCDENDVEIEIMLSACETLVQRAKDEFGEPAATVIDGSTYEIVNDKH